MVLEAITAALSLSAAVNASSADRRAKETADKLAGISESSETEKSAGAHGAGAPGAVVFPEVHHLLPIALIYSRGDTKVVRVVKVADADKPDSIIYGGTMLTRLANDPDLYMGENPDPIGMSWKWLSTAYPNALVVAGAVATNH